MNVHQAIKAVNEGSVIGVQVGLNQRYLYKVGEKYFVASNSSKVEGSPTTEISVAFGILLQNKPIALELGKVKNDFILIGS